MKTVLVIEDNLQMRENITEILQLAPYAVVQADNGKAGIELARQRRPDLIICDIMMPELDGYGVLHIVRKDPDLADVPFVFLTAKAELANFRTGMNLGADDYLTKPFDDLMLLKAVELRLSKGMTTPDDDPTVHSIRLEKLRRAIMNEADARQSLCAGYPTTPYNRKHRLFTEGTSPTSLYFIHEGIVKLSKTDTLGNEYITGLVGAGNFIGYVALLQEAPYAETAELLENAHICTIPQDEFTTLIHHHPGISIQLMQMLTAEVTELQERLLKLAYQPVRKRVAEALLLYQRRFYPLHHTVPQADGDTPAEPAINTSPAMTLSRENWAHLVGASTETVIRILSDLRAEGLINITASQIILLDIEKLNHLKR